MSAFRSLHSSILVLFAVVVIAIITLAHITISTSVAEQSRAQQESISPAFTLLVEQILQPLHIAQTLAKSMEIRSLLADEELQQGQAMKTLSRLAKEFDMLFFIASEKTRLQYNSDGSTLQLDPDQVNWYFKYRDQPKDAVADIGKWEDTHFYIDLKIYDEQGRFIGFFGVGKSLSYFLNIFAQYKQTFGYNFIFTDELGNITLSSDPTLVAADSVFQSLQDLAWYQQLDDEQVASGSLNNVLIKQDGQDYLIAEVNILPFNWTLYLLSPLNQRQVEISRGFIVSVAVLLMVIFLLFLLIYNLLYYFKRDMQSKVKVDPLTRLANRQTVESEFQQMLSKGHAVSLMLVDVDHLRSINDTFGHSAGDDVLQQVAEYLAEQLHPQDILGRWSSEEFILLLPDKGPHEAFDMAQKLREGLMQLPPPDGKPDLNVTASFGISFTAINRPMTEVLANADDALYQAKRDGCNLVRMQLIESH